MSTDGDKYFKTVQIVPFSEKQSDWRKWSLKFLANASVRGYRDILLGKVVVLDDSVVINDTTEEGREQVVLREKNRKAYNALILSCNDEVSLGAIELALMNEFTEGSAKKAWENLLEIFQPKTMSNKVELIKEFMNSVLNDSSRNLDMWIDELENIRKRLKEVGVSKTDEEMVMHVMNNLPKEYNVLVELLKNEMDNPHTTVDLSKLRLRLCARYQTMQQDLNKTVKD